MDLFAARARIMSVILCTLLGFFYELVQIEARPFPRVRVVRAQPVPRKNNWFLPLGLLGFTPDAGRPRAVRPDCDPREFATTLRGETNPAAQAFKIEQFTKRCEDRLTIFETARAFQEARLSQVRYRIENNPDIKRLEIRLSTSAITEGYLALNPRMKAAPLVVVLCGMACDLDKPSIRNAIMHLFDEAPFHVLALESVTGSAWIKRNKRLLLGGYSEGLLMLEAARLVYGGSFAKRFSEYHLVGMSLGGHATLFSGRYASDTPGARPSSVLAYCPAVDLEETLKTVDQSTFVGRFFRSTLRHQIFENRKDIQWPGPKPSEKDLLNLKTGELISYLERFLSPFLNRFPTPDRRSMDFTEFLKNNKFQNQLSHIAIPTIVLSAANDAIVPSLPNHQSLVESQARTQNPYLGLAQTARGGHCSHAMAYGWDYTSSILRELLLSQSRTLKSAKRTHALEPHLFPALSAGKQYFGDSWKFSKKGDAQLIVRVWEPSKRISESGDFCATYDPESAPITCFSMQQARFSHAELFGRALNQELSKAQAQAFTRWANSNMRLVNESMRSTNGTTEPISYVIWDDFSVDDEAYAKL
jgi:predicted alpha/beta-fold hydrolase